MARLFLDSGVFLEAISTQWSASKAILILGSHRAFLVETSEVVLAEVVGALGRKHFNPKVALATGLRIVTPVQLMRYVSLTDVPQPRQPRSARRSLSRS